MPRLRLLALGLLTVACAHARGADIYDCYNGSTEQGGNRITVNGIQSGQYVQQSYPGATVTVYAHNTLTLATIFQDAAGTLPLANPFTSSAHSVAFVCAPDGRYDFKYSGTGITVPFTVSDIKFCFACTGGGGGSGNVAGTVPHIAKFIGTTTVGDASGSDPGNTPTQWPLGLNVIAGAGYIQIAVANPGSVTGNGLVEYDSNSNLIGSLASSTKVIGIANVSGTNGASIPVAVWGNHACTFDNQTIANDYVGISTTVDTQCTDLGPSRPTGVEIIGRVTTVNTGAATLANVNLFTGDTIAPGSSGGSGTVSNCTTGQSNAYYSLAGTTVNCDATATDDGIGNMTMLSLGLTDVTKAGFAYLVQGTAPGIGPANSVTLSAPAAVTAYELLLPGTANSGFVKASNSAGVVTLSFTSLTWVCETGLGDGLNAMAAGTYLQYFCVNKTGGTVTLSGIHCFTDNNGTSTLNVANNAGTGLLTGAVTCNNTKAGGGAAGTQSATVTLASGDAANFTFVADGTSKQTTWTIDGTKLQ